MKLKYLSIVTAIAIVAASSSAFAKGGRDQKTRSGSGQSCNSGPPICGDGNCGGAGMCCDCFGLESIDVDSLTPEAESKRLYESFQARLKFIVPEDADVYLSGQLMSTLGVERSYLVSVNDQKRVYKYDIKVEVVRNGKKYFKQQTIRILRAGAILGIQVEAPPVPEGLPALIAIGVVPVAPGGPPADAEKDGAGEAKDPPALDEKPDAPMSPDEAPEPPMDNAPADDAPAGAPPADDTPAG
ncbi:MAG: hypothetical protein R3C59_00955 [Planctomycetaceae bacterium]